MDITSQPWFGSIRRPSRYLGEEIGAIKKDHRTVDLSIVLAFPDVYEVGMSHLGLKIIYHILNTQEWIAAERAFSPWTDLEERLRLSNIPLCSLETKRPLRDFDIVGFSLQHELCYTNVINMLDLAGIPIRSHERESGLPLVIAGGPACFNPEPMAEFFDAIVIGDGEEVALRICQIVREWKTQRGSKKELLEQLSQLRGVYVPCFFKPAYNSDGSFAALEPLRAGYDKIQKTKPVDLNLYPSFYGQIIPYTELVHDRLTIEVARGCGRGCRFCQAGFIYRPVRERQAGFIIRDADIALRCTGYDDLSLLSLSTGDYSSIEYLMTSLMDRYAEKKIAISLPSLRIDSLKGSFLKQIGRVRKTGFTLAVEAGNDRMRQIINKGLTEEEIISMAKTIYKSGWNLIKLYFMVGLPFERDRDVLDIVSLARLLQKVSPKRGKRAHLNVSVATFVPKSHTPFMWEQQLPLKEAQRRIGMIRDKLNGTRARVKWNPPEMSWLEGIFSRGDRRLSSVVQRAWSKGARFDAWAEHFNLGLWETALREEVLNPEICLLGQEDHRRTLPWDHIITGVSKDYFLSELDKAADARLTPDCREICSSCGVCDHKVIKPVLAEKKLTPAASSNQYKEPTESLPCRKYRFTFTKLGLMRYLSHLEMVRLMLRVLRRANIPMAHSRGYHPMPRISFASALPVGVESLVETFELETTRPMEPVQMLKEVNIQLPEGIQITQIEEIPLRSKSARIVESTYIIRLTDSSMLDLSMFEKYKSERAFVIIKKGKKGPQAIDLKHWIKSLEPLGPKEVKVKVKYQDNGPHLRPQEIVQAIFCLDAPTAGYFDIRKTEQIIE
ncbi:MAG TPA: TIGR03960 family B12-binding radical SAM protein [Desulfobacteraceae bacterium]|nr:TIGR03960 family B12-binding radical SAM protein [Desulfobacteraceae bacterium]